MSLETRQKLVDHPRLVLANHLQYDDIMDPDRTNTWLIQFMLSLVQSCAHPLLVTAIKTDHGTGTWHNSGTGIGRAFDFWNADWASEGDDKVRYLLQCAANISCSGQPRMIELGLSGFATQYLHTFNYCCDDIFIEDYGRSNEHCHIAVGVPT